MEQQISQTDTPVFNVHENMYSSQSFCLEHSNHSFMSEKGKDSPRPATSAPKEIPTIVAKPGGEQPGTRAIINKAEPEKQ